MVQENTNLNEELEREKKIDCPCFSIGKNWRGKKRLKALNLNFYFTILVS